MGVDNLVHQNKKREHFLWAICEFLAQEKFKTFVLNPLEVLYDSLSSLLIHHQEIFHKNL